MADKEEIKLHVLSQNTDVDTKKIHAWVNIRSVSHILGDRWQGKSWIILGKTQIDCLTEDDEFRLSELYLQGRIYPVKLHRDGKMTVTIGREESEVIDCSKKDTSLEGQTSPTTFTFKVNPSHLSIRKQKLFTKLRTKGGWVFQHWGADISEIALEGTTGNIRPNKFRLVNKQLPESIPWIGSKSVPVPTSPAAQFADRDNSPLLDVFRRLEEVYNQDQDENAIRKQQILTLEYRKRMYVGHLADFSYEERAERPFQFYYKLTFLVHYEATNAAAVQSGIVTNAIRNEETLQRIKEIKDESNITDGDNE